jgi:hypothetical protein
MGVSALFFLKTSIPTHGSNHLPKAPLLNTIALRFKILT